MVGGGYYDRNLQEVRDARIMGTFDRTQFFENDFYLGYDTKCLSRVDIF